MAKFRLMEKDAQGNKTGRHCMGPVVKGHFSRIVRPGEVIESNDPLDVLFKNKFERLPDATPEPEPEAEPRQAKRSRKA